MLLLMNELLMLIVCWGSSCWSIDDDTVVDEWVDDDRDEAIVDDDRDDDWIDDDPVVVNEWVDDDHDEWIDMLVIDWWSDIDAVIVQLLMYSIMCTRPDIFDKMYPIMMCPISYIR